MPILWGLIRFLSTDEETRIVEPGAAEVTLSRYVTS